MTVKKRRANTTILKRLINLLNEKGFLYYKDVKFVVRSVDRKLDKHSVRFVADDAVAFLVFLCLVKKRTFRSERVYFLNGR